MQKKYKDIVNHKQSPQLYASKDLIKTHQKVNKTPKS